MLRSTPNVRIDPCTEVLALIDQMHRAAGNRVMVHQLTDQLEVLTRSYFAPAVADPIPGEHLTKTSARILSRLMSAGGQMVSKEQLMDALYFDRAYEPDVKILDVLICNLRKKLRGSRYRIETLHGEGWKLESDQ